MRVLSNHCRVFVMISNIIVLILMSKFVVEFFFLHVCSLQFISNYIASIIRTSDEIE